jgi:alpha-galactosidase
VDIQGFWRPGNDRGRTLPADWSEGFISQSTTHAPVGCLYNLNGQNRHTWAFSDALNPVEILAGVHEETAVFRFSLTLFKVCAPFKEYAATLRLDTRARPYFESVNEVQAWWAAQPGYVPAPVPAAARQPIYSTWYSFHQRLEAAAIEEQCRLAQRLGCAAVIVDDGWQTFNNDRGYAYCGDWQVWAEKIPDMAAHVARVHALGLKYILWYALPFVGPHSRIFSRFKGKYLAYLENHATWVLDPRFPDVREYLINVYETAMRDWGVDGFKLDFVQHFKQPLDEDLLPEPAGNQPEEAPDQGGRDYTSVPEAADRLLGDLLERLRRINPDVLIEFRQPYIGPLMRKYGNMFRAGDCPNDSLLNRLKTLDVRLLAGSSAPHADMLMWHSGEPVESAALQLINVLFAVPQISVCLEKLPVEHHKMLQFWLAFWTQHKELLLDGELKPWHPELGYTEVEVLNSREQLIAVYARVIPRPSLPLRDKITLVNGTLEEGVVLDCREAVGRCRLKILNCMGEVLSNTERDFPAGLVAIAVPPAGLAVLER